ncbi:MAG TPA: sigma 54-interacting transcriptional regulator, partial [Candidatus Polarisedimenticolaceae bacterium]|nr:sigma 54-interacting transcriptional regulator [Candidatus Polarisedimenticolaceae bacterium]
MEPPWAVVVDRNPASRTLMSEVLEQHGFSVRRVDDPWQTLDTPATRSASLVSLAFESTQDRLDSLIERLAQLEPRPLIVGVGDPGSTLSTELASELYDLVPAPIGRAALERMVRRCKTRLALVKRLERLQEELKHRHGFSGFVGRGDAMRRVRSELERLSVTDDPVWISGEPGTGKESAARQLHATSPRRESEFVPIDCTELSRVADVLPTSGEFPRGEGGTLYLAELPALRPDLQEELLRTVGMLRARGIRAPRGVRLVVGSRLDPTRAGSEGRLLPELQRQLSTHAIAIPPLRERREEIVLLADHFLSQICEINRLRRIHLGHETIARLESYPW